MADHPLLKKQSSYDTGDRVYDTVKGVGSLTIGRMIFNDGKKGAFAAPKSMLARGLLKTGGGLMMAGGVVSLASALLAKSQAAEAKHSSAPATPESKTGDRVASLGLGLFNAWGAKQAAKFAGQAAASHTKAGKIGAAVWGIASVLQGVAAGAGLIDAVSDKSSAAESKGNTDGLSKTSGDLAAYKAAKGVAAPSNGPAQAPQAPPSAGKNTRPADRNQLLNGWYVRNAKGTTFWRKANGQGG